MADINIASDKSHSQKIVLAVFDGSEMGVRVLDDLMQAGSTIVVVSVGVHGTHELRSVIQKNNEKNVNDQSQLFCLTGMDFIAVSGLVKTTVEKYGRIDGFVYFLHCDEEGGIEDTSLEIWQSVMAATKLMFHFYRVVAKQMAKQQYGSILGVSFGVNARGDADMLAWTVNGESMVGMSKCLAGELLKQKIRVNTLLYGYMNGVSYPKKAHEVMEQYSAFLGINRKGSAADISNYVKFLISDDGEYVTGQTLFVNGGLLI